MKLFDPRRNSEVLSLAKLHAGHLSGRSTISRVRPGSVSISPSRAPRVTPADGAEVSLCNAGEFEPR